MKKKKDKKLGVNSRFAGCFVVRRRVEDAAVCLEIVGFGGSVFSCGRKYLLIVLGGVCVVLFLVLMLVMLLCCENECK